jgi:hydrogenase/urease accessory protein HupE
MRTITTLLLACSAAALPAHDPGLSSLCVEVSGPRLTATISWANADFAQSLGRGCDRDGDGAVTPTELEGAVFTPPANTWVRATLAGTTVAFAVQALEIDATNDVVCRLAAAVATQNGALTVQVPVLGQLTHGHRQFATLRREGIPAGETLLSARDTGVTWDLSADVAPAPRTQSFLTFLALGVEHVVTGYDHVLFVLALLLSVATVGQALAVVTAFTLSHSLTLALAVLDVAHLPSTLVECAIAASVAFVGAENLLRREPARVRWTFAFGLLHGFGFAGCLSDLGVGQGVQAVVPLLGFNLGVEAGQLALVAVVLPLLLALRRRSAAHAGRVAAFASSAIIVCGVLWLLERLP